MKLELKTLIGALDANTRREIESAAQRAIQRNGTEILIEDVLFVMLNREESMFNKLLQQYEIDSTNMRTALEKTFQSASQSESANPVFSKQLIEWIESAYLCSKIELELKEITEVSLFYAFFKESIKYSNTSYFKLFVDIDVDELLELIKGLAEEEQEATMQPSLENQSSSSNSEFKKYTTNLTELAKEGKIDPVLARDSEIKQAIDILSRRRKNNPIMVGEAGVGKTAVVEGLALKIINKDVPKHLYNAQIILLDLGALQSGASVKGEFERRLQVVINAIKSSTQFSILFIDEAHTLIGAGGNAGGGDAANLLKPALARGELKTIAATTWLEYRKYFEKDPALARRFQKIDILEPTVDESITILRGISDKYEEMHDVYIEDDALIASATLSARYITGRQLPDKAIDVLDTACANVKISASNRPFALQTMDGKLAILQREYDSLEKDHKSFVKDNSTELEELKKEMEIMRSSISTETELWEKQKELLESIKILKKEEDREAILKEYAKLKEIQESTSYIYETVNKEQIAEVISSWTGIPLGAMKQKQVESITQLSEGIKKRIIGQDEAVDYMSQFLQISMAGLKKESTPEGVFLLVGPSGVGKTETALAVADMLFGGKSFITTVNMSEFQEKHTVSRLIGSPPGYVGYGDGGQLTDPVRVKPYSVVLLDEIEKAHPDILNLFYQIFDKGVANDGEGREIDFKNTVIIMTSNLATDEITDLILSNSEVKMEEISKKITPILTQYLKPALLGRMNVIPYRNLSVDALKKIVRLKLNSIENQLMAKNMEVSFDEKLIEHVVNLSNSTETGARNLELIINNTLLPKLSKELLQSTVDNRKIKSIKVTLDENSEIFLDVIYEEEL